MPELSKEAMENIDKVMEIIRDKPAEEKVNKIFMCLGVRVHPVEAVMAEKILKEIIEGRMLRTCPKCKGNFTPGIMCDLCEGHGEVNGVMEEKFFLNQMEKQHKTKKGANYFVPHFFKKILTNFSLSFFFLIQ